MRWPWPRRRHPITVDIEPAREAAETLRAAQGSLAKARARQSDVDQVVHEHRTLQWKNHLGSNVRRALMEERQP